MFSKVSDLNSQVSQHTLVVDVLV
jgi:hypothetical protein